MRPNRSETSPPRIDEPTLTTCSADQSSGIQKSGTPTSLRRSRRKASEALPRAKRKITDSGNKSGRRECAGTDAEGAGGFAEGAGSDAEGAGGFAEGAGI